LPSPKTPRTEYYGLFGFHGSGVIGVVVYGLFGSATLIFGAPLPLAPPPHVVCPAGPCYLVCRSTPLRSAANADAFGRLLTRQFEMPPGG
jgi:hypothetical protein